MAVWQLLRILPDPRIRRDSIMTVEPKRGMVVTKRIRKTRNLRVTNGKQLSNDYEVKWDLITVL